MLKTTLIIIAVFFSILQLNAQATDSGFSFGSDEADYLKSTITDSEGNLIMVGSFSSTVDFNTDPLAEKNISSSGDIDGFIAKYTANGSLLWVIKLGSTGSDEVSDVAIDKNGNIMVIGNFYETIDFNPSKGQNFLTAENSDIFVAKYTSDGIFISCKKIGGSGLAFGRHISVSKGVYFISGSFQETVDFNPGSFLSGKITADLHYDLFIAKYNTDETFQWVKKITAQTSALISDMELDENEHVYLAGEFYGSVDFDPGRNEVTRTSNGQYDAFLVKINTDGTYGWCKTYGNEFEDKVSDIVIRGTHIYIAGFFNGTLYFSTGGLGISIRESNGSLDMLIIEYNTGGDYVRSKSFGSTGYDYISSIEIDKANNFYISGGIQPLSSVDFDFSSLEQYYLVSTSDDIGSFYASYTENFDFRYAEFIENIMINEIDVISTDHLNLSGINLGTTDLIPGADSLMITSNGNRDIFSLSTRPFKTGHSITSFQIEGQINSSIDDENKSISVLMPYNTDHYNLISTYTISDGATIVPVNLSGDYNDSVYVEVFAEDTSIHQSWMITVSNQLNTEAELISFDISAYSCISSIDKTNKEITITMNEECDITSLEPSILFSDDASIVPASNVAQDFTNPVTYTVTSQDLSNSVEWTVTVVPFSTVGYSTIKNQDLKIFPNPITDKLYIETATAVKYAIFNSTGQCIQAETKLQSGLNAIYLNGIHKGVYTLKIRTSENKVIHRIVVK